jgi:hypothetical protein
MRRGATITILTILAVLATACGEEAAEPTTSTAAEPTTSTAPATTSTTSPETTTTVAEDSGHDHEAGSGDPEITPEIAAQVAQIRAGTAGYVNDRDAAVEDGFFIITQMIPDMGYHFLNPSVEGFDIGQPPILVYSRDGDAWELGAVEWVFPEVPAEPPMEGATYGAFPAACHFDDGIFVPTATEEEWPETNPDTGAAFTFWHPNLVTFHVWAWMQNPAGLYNGTNPLMSAHNDG